MSYICDGHFFWSKGLYGIKVLGPEDKSELYRIAALYIPEKVICYECTDGEDAGKLRAEKAKVLAITIVRRGQNREPILEPTDYGSSGHYSYYATVTRYQVNEIVSCDEEFSLYTTACASGIHFFTSVDKIRDFIGQEEFLFGDINNYSTHMKYLQSTQEDIERSIELFLTHIQAWFHQVVLRDGRKRVEPIDISQK